MSERKRAEDMTVAETYDAIFGEGTAEQVFDADEIEEARRTWMPVSLWSRTEAGGRLVGEIMAKALGLDDYKALLAGGLGDADRQYLHGLCFDFREEYAEAELDVVEFVRYQIGRLGRDWKNG